MLLTPEQLSEYRRLGKGRGFVSAVHLRNAVANIDAQQARIDELDGLLTSASNHCNATANERNALQGRVAELEENAEAHALAMKACKAMLQSETERADMAEARAKSECAQNTSLLYLLAQIREACGDNGKRMQDELVAYIGELAGSAEAGGEWRRLALQFDGHRMQALAHLRCLLENPLGHAEAVTAFLAAPPLSGEQVLAERIAALVSPEEPTEAMIDAPRQFLLFYAGAHRAVRTEEMRRHLDLAGVDYSCWPHWALDGDADITKAGAAILIWAMMANAAMKSSMQDAAT